MKSQQLKHGNRNIRKVSSWQAQLMLPVFQILGWSMCTSFIPPMVAISIGKTRYSHKLISEGKEFVFAYPGEDMEKEVLYCGTHSGQDVNKFKELGLIAIPAKRVRPPLIDRCIVNMECKVVGQLDTGDHTIFVGEIVASYISDEKKRRLYNLGNEKFGGL
ncbi:flavin reductase family protein [Candidatus Acetothermia bacterium]|nr:flavin reductase family protein [Candidatus Acetothermia bacterium]